MPPPASVFHQPNVQVTAVPAWSLVPSPRNYNASILEFEGKRLMAYRSHRMDQQGRCGIVVCDLTARWEAKKNTWLNLPEQVASVMVHHEDPRLFVFKDRLHCSFTETSFHGATSPYTCVMKYARLKKTTKGWVVERVFHPRYGYNSGAQQEKNWQFFQPRNNANLHFIYQAEPHRVIELGKDGETALGGTESDKGFVRWPWGTIRGGTPPIRLNADRWLTIFHSATPYPIAPYWRRYYAGAYVFDAKPPYRITEISQRPILTGSLDDGHAHDPRNIDSWKPFVVFPAGIIKANPGSWHVSYGVNDHLTAIATHTDLYLGDPAFTGWGPKFFRCDNGSKPVRFFVKEDSPPAFIQWVPSRLRPGAGQSAPGILQVDDPRVAMHLHDEVPGVEEISREQFAELKG